MILSTHQACRKAVVWEAVESSVAPSVTCWPLAQTEESDPSFPLFVHLSLSLTLFRTLSPWVFRNLSRSQKHTHQLLSSCPLSSKCDSLGLTVLLVFMIRVGVNIMRLINQRKKKESLYNLIIMRLIVLSFIYYWFRELLSRFTLNIVSSSIVLTLRAFQISKIFDMRFF